MKTLIIIIEIILASQLAGCLKHSETPMGAHVSAKTKTDAWEKMNTSGIVYIMAGKGFEFHAIRGSVWHTSDSIDDLMNYVEDTIPNAELFTVIGGLLVQETRDKIYLRVTKPKEGANIRGLISFQVLSAFVPSLELRDILKDRHSKGEGDLNMAGTSKEHETNKTNDYNTKGLVYVVMEGSQNFHVFRGSFWRRSGNIDMAMEGIDKDMVNAEIVSFISFVKLEPEKQNYLYSKIVNSKGPNSHRVFSFLMPSSADSSVVDIAPVLCKKLLNTGLGTPLMKQKANCDLKRTVEGNE